MENLNFSLSSLIYGFGRHLRALLGLVIILLFSGTSFATTYYVDNTNGSCTDAGAGTTQAIPFCTIGKGATVALAGDTVSVLAGTYAETVNPAHSGSAGNPIVFSAEPGVTVTGNNGIGFTMTGSTGHSYIVIDGFTIQGTTSYGISASASDHITISNNDVSLSGTPASGGVVRIGIYFTASHDSLITGNITHENSQDGIRLTGGSYNNVVMNNISWGNAEQWQRNATGIQVTGAGSDNNTIIHNVTYANEDSGIQFYSGAKNNMAIGNLTYGNGDHGIDNNNAQGNTIVGNTVHGNVTAGINLEGGSAATGSFNATLANNIAVDNGLRLQVGGGTASGQPTNIRVDANSTAGTTIDYDLVYLSSGTGMIQWNGTTYNSLSDFQSAVSGQEVHGLQGDPLFVTPAPIAQRPASAPFNVAVNAGDYHLTEGSPAIDSANSDAPGETDVDIEGIARFDDPGTTNTGAGTRDYDDRGAFEFASVFCGDGSCNGEESCETCSQDCGACNEAYCGDDACNGDETCLSCAQDCGACNEAYCGDGACNGDETCLTCAQDCGACNEPHCDDGACNDDETCLSCSQDCGACNGAYCGDGACNGAETCLSCSQDCGACNGAYCGDGACNGAETCLTCSQDCGACNEPHCNDGACNDDETCLSCPQDCGTCNEPHCGDVACNDDETCDTCFQDCGDCNGAYCGDGACNGAETCDTCSQDCGACNEAHCGDAACNGDETCGTCPQDCGSCNDAHCGDDACNGDETCLTCGADCGSCNGGSSCGDGVCDTGETCGTCSQDCGACNELHCGDRTCNDQESCDTCERDCGVCDTGEPPSSGSSSGCALSMNGRASVPRGMPFTTYLILLSPLVLGWFRRRYRGPVPDRETES